MCASGLPTPLHSMSCSRSFQDLDSISRLIVRFWITYQLLQQAPSSHHCFLTYLIQWFFTRGRRHLQSSQQGPPFQASFLTLPGSDSLAALYSRRSDTELLQPQLRVWLSNEKPAFFFLFFKEANSFATHTCLKLIHQMLQISLKYRLDSYVSSQA